MDSFMSQFQTGPKNQESGDMDAFMAQFMTKPRPNTVKNPKSTEVEKPEEQVESKKPNDPSEMIKKLQ